MNVARLQLASSGLLAVIGTMPAIALAWTTACTDMKAETFPLAMPTSISVPRDLPDGSSISAWIYAPDSPFWASCTTRESSAGIGYEPPPGLSKTRFRIYGNATSYSVFQTNVPGIGVAFSGYNNYDGGYWMVDLGSRSNPWPWSGRQASTATYVLAGWLAAILVKTGPVTTAGTVVLPSIRAGVGEEWKLLPIYKTYTFRPINVVPLSCTVADAMVELGDVASSQFHGVGSASRGTHFTLNVNNCPAGMRSISLRVHPTQGVVGGTDDVAKLDAGSTATGVGVQLQWANGDHLKLDGTTVIEAYQGQAMNIPLNLHAAYYQTDKIVQPGTANASFEVTLFFE